jgi:hypothetical protein
MFEDAERHFQSLAVHFLADCQHDKVRRRRRRRRIYSYSMIL